MCNQFLVKNQKILKIYYDGWYSFKSKEYKNSNLLKLFLRKGNAIFYYKTCKKNLYNLTNEDTLTIKNVLHETHVA